MKHVESDVKETKQTPPTYPESYQIPSNKRSRSRRFYMGEHAKIWHNFIILPAVTSCYSTSEILLFSFVKAYRMNSMQLFSYGRNTALRMYLGVRHDSGESIQNWIVEHVLYNRWLYPCHFILNIYELILGGNLDKKKAFWHALLRVLILSCR